MKIIIDTPVIARLLCYAVATGNEFSGFGFCERRDDGNIFMYDFVLLDVGTWGFTQTDLKQMLPLFERADRKNMKIWVHRHPVGNGVPGSHNWSARDEQTIKFEPLGADPKDIGWSVSIVLTPGGFVGRIDNYLKNITQHLEVEPVTRDFFAELRSLEASLSPLTTSQNAGQKSRRSNFPAPESTGKKRKPKIKVGIRSSKNGKKKSSKTQLTATLARFMTSFASSVTTMIRPLQRSRIYARSTASIGSRNTTIPAATRVSTDCGGSNG